MLVRSGKNRPSTVAQVSACHPEGRAFCGLKDLNPRVSLNNATTNLLLPDIRYQPISLPSLAHNHTSS
jgi:hypothetical protein